MNRVKKPLGIYNSATTLIYFVFILCLLAPLPVAAANLNYAVLPEQATPDLPNHYILLVDASGSMGKRPTERVAIGQIITGIIPQILQGARQDSRGETLEPYRPGKDYLSLFTFGIGLAPEEKSFKKQVHPQFVLESGQGLFERAALELTQGSFSGNWTGVTTALPLAVAAVREFSGQGRPQGLLGSTVVLMLTDDVQNLDGPALNEISRLRAVGVADSTWAGEMIAGVQRYYEYNQNLLYLEGLGPSKKWHLHMRLIQPRRAALTELVRVPTELSIRRTADANGVTATATLPLSFLFTDSQPRGSFQPLEVRLREEGAAKYLSQALTGDWLRKKSDLEIPLSFSTAAPGSAGHSPWPAHLDVAFIYHLADPVYGLQAVTYHQQVALHLADQDKLTLFGVLKFPLSNELLANIAGSELGLAALMRRPPVTARDVQDLVDRIAAVAVAILFLILGALFLAYWFIPPLKVGFEPGFSTSNPVIVDFNRRQGEHPAVISSAVLKNRARRKLGLIPIRPARFAVRLIVGDNPEQAERGLESAHNLVGLSTTFETQVTRENCTPGNEIISLFNPTELSDYRGQNRGEDLHYVISVDHIKRRLPPLRWFGSEYKFRPVGDWEVPVRTEFIPQETRPVVSIVLAPGVAEDGLEHHADDPRTPLGELVVTSSATLHCSRPVSCLLTLYFDEADRGDFAGASVNNGQLVLGDPRVESATGSPALWSMVGLAGERDKASDPEPGSQILLRVNGLGKDDALRFPLFLDCSRLENPRTGAKTYSLGLRQEIKLADDDPPVSAEDWATFVLHRDRRKTDLRLELEVWGREEPLVLTHPVGDQVFAPESPVNWSPNDQSTRSRLIKLTIANTAVSGAGQLQAEIGAGEVIADNRLGNLTLKPGFQVPDILVWQDEADTSAATGNLRTGAGEVSIPDSKPARSLALQMELQDITGMESHEIPLQVVIPVSYRIAPEPDPAGRSQPARTGRFAIKLALILSKYLGPAYLAIDFGTSAVAIAFEGDILRLTETDEHGHPAPQSLLDLQGCYMKAGGASPEEIKKRKDNPEFGTRFASSLGLLRPNEAQCGKPGFFDLSATWLDFVVRSEWLVPFLKTLISQNFENIPLPAAIEYRDNLGKKETGKPPLLGTVVSAYHDLYGKYIAPLLKEGDLLGSLNKAIVAFPNTFTLSHQQILRDLLTSGESPFTELREVLTLSESDASAIYYLYHEKRLRQEQPGTGEVPIKERVLVYDIGAGTLDLTMAEVIRQADPERAPQTVEYLAKMGIPVAGNALDTAIARHIHARLKRIDKELAKSGKNTVNPGQRAFAYARPIVHDPKIEVDENYRRAMLVLWKGILDWKKRYSQKPNDENLMVLLGDSNACVIQVDDFKANEALFRSLGLEVRPGILAGGGNGLQYLLNINIKDLRGEPAVRYWEECVADWALAEFLRQVEPDSGKTRIDAVVLSGRTLLWPGLHERVMKLIREAALEPDGIFVPQLKQTETKSAVVIGLIIYALLWRSTVEFKDRNIWGRYGLLYDSAGERAFYDLFPNGVQNAERIQDTIQKRTIYMPKSQGVIDVGSTTQVSLCYTFVSDPVASIHKKNQPNPWIRTAALIDAGRPLAIKDHFGHQVKEITFTAEVKPDNELKIILSAKGMSKEFLGGKGALPALQAWPIAPVALKSF